MSTTHAATVSDPRVALWRFDRLRAAHCPPGIAMSLATRRDVDLHAAVALLDGGCPPNTALTILM